MDRIEIIIFIGISGFILFLFMYMLKRDKEIDSKMAAMELALEDMNQEIFKLKKDLKNADSNKALKDIEQVVETILENIKAMEAKHKKHIKELENKLYSIEHSVKNKMVDFSNINKSDEQRIINLYKNGYSIEEISRELRIPAGEVELVIKFQNF
jgi:DNA-binding NarL/FixJ family response regulator